MTDARQVQQQAALSLERLWPRLEITFRDEANAVPADWRAFEMRLRHEWERLFGLLLGLYGGHYDFFYHLEELLGTAARSWFARPTWLKQLDARREADPAWFQSPQMVGGMCYVDLFAGTLNGLRERLPYFKKLGLTYLHLMPLFESPEGNSDGGYAISSYRRVNPRLGTIEELAELAHEFHKHGISLVLDFIFNHTSDEHEWARRAQAGDYEYEQFYFLYPDRTMPDAYERTLREIFPTVRRGCFTWREDMRKWVWTTFNSFQWDLNYANPAVFRAMAEEMLFIANTGVEFLRLDAVAFIWKRMGTNCENQPEAHQIIQAFNSIARIAAPAMLFKSEAIVHPDDVLSYISPRECQISYNPLLMALLWESLATSEVKLLAHSLRHRFRLPRGTAWVNYLRSHDDIGWTFDDSDARREWIDANGHRTKTNWAWQERVQPDPHSPHGRIFAEMVRLIALRKQQPALYDSDTAFVETGNRHLFGYVRHGGGQRLFVVANFSAHPQGMDANRLRAYGADDRFTDLVIGHTLTAEQPLRLEAYQCMWLQACSAV